MLSVRFCKPSINATPIRDVRKGDGGIELRPQNIVAEGDHVVVEAQGKARTKSGQDYNNTYCFVYRLAGGKIVEGHEYMDTELVTRVLG